MNKKGSSMWLWVIIVCLILGIVVVYGLLKLEFNLAKVFLAMFSGK